MMTQDHNLKANTKKTLGGKTPDFPVDGCNSWSHLSTWILVT